MREIVSLCCSSRAAGAKPPARGVCTRAAHRGREYRGVPATPRLASARGPSRSARVGDGAVGVRHGRAVTKAVRPPDAASDAMEARGLAGLRQGHRWQDGGGAPRQHRLARHEITSHCRYYHSLSPLSPHAPLQEQRLKEPRGSGQECCRLKGPRASIPTPPT